MVLIAFPPNLPWTKNVHGWAVLTSLGTTGLNNKKLAFFSKNVFFYKQTQVGSTYIYENKVSEALSGKNIKTYIRLSLIALLSIVYFGVQ